MERKLQKRSLRLVLCKDLKFIWVNWLVFKEYQFFFHKSNFTIIPKGRSWIQESPDNEESELHDKLQNDTNPFRNRASTDGNLVSRPRKWRFSPQEAITSTTRICRRMSISMRGNNASY